MDLKTQSARPPMAIDALPKAELHLHLEGSIRPETTIKLAARHGVVVMPEEVAARYDFSNFNGFLETFKWVTSFLRTPDDYALITRQLCEELVRQNVVYAELTISAGVILRRTQNLEAIVSAIRDATQSAPLARLRTAFILDAARQFGHDPAKEVAACAAKLQPLGVVAFGMGGDELAYPTINFRPAFDLARHDGLHVVCHAGEIGGPDSVREAIELLGAERIGHGIAVMRDTAFADTLAMRRVVLEICPTSNLCTGALARQTEKVDASLRDHPLPDFIKRGIAVTLSTDDPGMFDTDLLTEYSNVASLGVSTQHLVQLMEQSFHAAFLPPDEKRKYLVDFRTAADSAGLL
ncbi:MAG TPA: adenosine deaminase [Candidatus Acidoferrales bacterium]